MVLVWRSGQRMAEFSRICLLRACTTLYQIWYSTRKAWVQPRIVTFFLFVLVFWYWVGIRVESWRAAETTDLIDEKPSRTYVLYALGAALWILVAVGTAWDVASVVHAYSWYGLRYLYGDWELLHSAQFLWSVILAVYYSRRFVREFKLKATA